MANYSRFDYVKKYEQDDSLLRDCWIVVRIDGHEFRSFADAHKFEKPNDLRALKLMNYCALEVMKACGGIILAFGASDEYSFVFKRNCDLYNRRASKLATFISSTFTSNFVYYWSQFFPSTPLKYPPVFNGRATAFPTNKSIRDYFSWRQTECHVHNLYDTCFWGLVQKSNTAEEAEGKLEGISPDALSELLFTSCGIIYTKLPEIFRRGSIVIWSEDKDQEKDDDSDSPGTRSKSKLVILHEDLITQDFYERHPGILPARRAPIKIIVKESQKEPEKVDAPKKDSGVILSVEHRRTGSSLAQVSFSTPRGPEPMTSATSIATSTPDGDTEQAAMYGIPDASNFGSQRTKLDSQNPYAVMAHSSFSPLVCGDCGSTPTLCSCSSRDFSTPTSKSKTLKGTKTPPIITTITTTATTTATTTVAATVTMTTSTTASISSTTTSGKLRKETPTPTPGETSISPYSLFGSTNFGRTASTTSGEHETSGAGGASPKTPALNAPSTPSPYAPLPSASFTLPDTDSDPASIYRPVAASNFEGLSSMIAESQRVASLGTEILTDVSDDGTPSPHSSPSAMKISRSQSSTLPIFESAGGRLPPPADRGTSLQRSYSSQSATSAAYTADTTRPVERRKSLPASGVRKEPGVADNKLDALQELEELDIDIEAKDFYKATFERTLAAELLEGKAYGTYLFRPCSDPHEFIDNKPNTNLFVLSYCGKGKMANVKVFRFPGQGLGNRRDPSKCTVYRTITSFVKNVLCGQTGAPVSDPT